MSVERSFLFIYKKYISQKYLIVQIKKNHNRTFLIFPLSNYPNY